MLARALDFHEVGGKLNTQRRVRLDRKFQEYRFYAGIAAEHDADVLGFSPAQLLEFRHREWRQWRQGLTVRPGQRDALVVDMQFILRRDVDAHGSPGPWFVANSVRLAGILALALFVILDVFLVVPFEPDDLR